MIAKGTGMDSKLIAMDMDGTLLNSDKKITRRTAQTLKTAAERGIHIVLATGRTVSGVNEYLETLPFIRYLITVNGGCIWDAARGASLHDAVIPAARAREIFAFLEKYDTMYDCYIDGKGYIDRRYWNTVPNYLPDENLVRLVRITRVPVDDFAGCVEEAGKGVQKIQMFFNDPEKRLAAIREMEETFPDIAVTWSLLNNVEINTLKANKGEALTVLAKHLGLDIANTMAFGDGWNDRTMLLTAGCAVAMENSMPNVKGFADHVTLTNDEDGVAHAIEKLVLQ